MVDIHSHILFGVDDGAQNLEESIELLKQAEKVGYTDIVCSSHYYKGRFENNNYIENFKILQTEIDKQNININIYSGNEFALKEDSFFCVKEAQKINNSKYLLIELKGMILFSICKSFFVELLNNGIVPIFAHVERYQHIKLSELIELYKLGVILQVNINSALEPIPKIKYLLDNRYIDILATDTHRVGRRDYNLKDKLEKLKKILGEDYFTTLLENNPKIILNNNNIEHNNKGEKDEFKKKISIFNIFKSMYNKLFRR